MKKQLFLSIIAATCVTIALQAGGPPTGSFDPIIEVSNKQGGSSVQVDIAEIGPRGRVNYPTVYIQDQQRWNSGQRVVDMNSVIEMTFSNQGKMVGRYIIDAPGKTKYVTWDGKKLYPRTGPLGGLGKVFGMKTDTGLSLANNLSSSQIQNKTTSGGNQTQPSKPVNQPTQPTRPISQPSQPVSQPSQPVSSALDVEITNKLNKQIIIGFGRDQEILEPNRTYEGSISNKGSISVEVYDVKRDLIPGSDYQDITYSGTQYNFAINPVNKQTIYLEVVSGGSGVTLRPKNNTSSNVQQNEIQSRGSSKVEKTNFIMGSINVG